MVAVVGVKRKSSPTPTAFVFSEENRSPRFYRERKTEKLYGHRAKKPSGGSGFFCFFFSGKETCPRKSLHLSSLLLNFSAIASQVSFITIATLSSFLMFLPLSISFLVLSLLLLLVLHWILHLLGFNLSGFALFADY